MKPFAAAAAFAILAAPVLADGHASGDANAGGEQFRRQCIACHVIQDARGEILAGRNAKVGPNLYGVVARPIADVAGFRYGDGLVELGDAGAIWTEANLTGFIQDPTDWLRDTLQSRRARTKMAYQVRNAQDATDLFAYLASFGDQDAARASLATGADNPLNQ